MPVQQIYEFDKLMNKKEISANRTSNGEEHNPFEFIDKKGNGYKIVEARDFIDVGFSKLSPRLVYILTHYYGLNGQQSRNFEEIGKELGLSRESIRKKHNSAIRQLRSLN